MSGTGCSEFLRLFLYAYFHISPHIAAHLLFLFSVAAARAVDESTSVPSSQLLDCSAANSAS